MKKTIGIFGILAIVVVGLAACGAPAEPQLVQMEPQSPAVDEQPPEAQPPADAMEEASEQVLPAWFSQELTDVNTGSAFKVTDFNGKVILVETMAIWCPKCLSQQKEVARLHTALAGRDDFVSLGIDIDPNEDAAMLADYVKKNGFNWLYTVAPDAVVNDISALYGTQFLNPPATPMLIIDKQGNQHPLPFGIKSAEDLQEALQPFLDASN